MKRIAILQHVAYEGPARIADWLALREPVDHRSRAEGLAERHPDLATELLEFAENQAAENTYIDENLIGAIWVLQRS